VPSCGRFEIELIGPLSESIHRRAAGEEPRDRLPAGQTTSKFEIWALERRLKPFETFSWRSSHALDRLHRRFRRHLGAVARRIKITTPDPRDKLNT
jgi:hypothetical protein